MLEKKSMLTNHLQRKDVGTHTSDACERLCPRSGLFHQSLCAGQQYIAWAPGYCPYHKWRMCHGQDGMRCRSLHRPAIDPSH